MKVNGFTLMELLATIILIGILGTISFGVILNSLDGTKSNLDEFEKELLTSTAKWYFDDNVDTSTAIDGTVYNICIQQNLVDDGYLDEFKDDQGNDYTGIVKLTTVVDGTGTIKDITSSISEGTESGCY